MTFPVDLPATSWGPRDAPRSALLIHGLGSTAALMWRFATALAEDGWRVTAVDLRGHGAAPRTLDYTLAAYGADVRAVRAPSGTWDLVLGHSLGGAATVLAAAEDADWARRVVLVDPALHLLPEDRETVRRSQAEAFADTSPEAVERAHPHWHPQDVRLKALAAQQADPWAIEQTSIQNPEWDVVESVARLTVPTHVIASDPEVYSIYAGKIEDEVAAANPGIGMSVVPGAGHSPHRDEPEATIAILREVLA